MRLMRRLSGIFSSYSLKLTLSLTKAHLTEEGDLNARQSKRLKILYSRETDRKHKRQQEIQEIRILLGMFETV